MRLSYCEFHDKYHGQGTVCFDCFVVANSKKSSLGSTTTPAKVDKIVTDDYVLAPKEPTDAMYEAGQSRISAGPRAVYRAMIEASMKEVTE